MATITSNIGPERTSPSTVTFTTAFRQPAKTTTVDQRYATLPPKGAFVVSFVRFATAPLMPALAMLAK